MKRPPAHRVGLTAVVVGLVGLFGAAWASVSPNRVVTATPVALTEALPPLAIAVLVALWIVVAGFSLLGGRSRGGALGRGLSAVAVIVALVSLSGIAATRLVADAGQFGRYTIGGGVWISAFAAFALIVASRREVGIGTRAGWTVTLLAPLAIVALALTGRLSDLGVAAEYRNVADQFPVWVWEQFAYSAAAIVVATFLGVALGILAHRNERYAGPIFTVANVFQTIPGLAMVGILVVPMGTLGATFPWLHSLGVGGIGWAPVVLALTLYALLAIVRNTYAGLGAVPPAAVDAGVGMGMAPRQLMRKVQLPLATPILFTGIRVSTQQTIGNATLGAFVAAGTLGAPIFLGFAQQANDLVLLGSMALVVLAITVDGALRGAQHALTPRGIRKGHS